MVDVIYARTAVPPETSFVGGEIFLMVETSNSDGDLIGAFVVTILIWLTSALTR